MKRENKLRELRVHYSASQPSSLEEKITTSAKAYEFLIKSFDKKTLGCQEQFNVLFLNQANIPIGIYKASRGGINSTIADIRLILGMALKSLASGLILSHNHPSGNLKPSEADLKLTKKFKDACGLLDICLVDHIIISPFGESYSFSENGLMQ
jgi:DNA repair protein RadC